MASRPELVFERRRVLELSARRFGLKGEKAFFVAHERNKAVHAAPGSTVDPDEIPAELAIVVDALM